MTVLVLYPIATKVSGFPYRAFVSNTSNTFPAGGASTATAINFTGTGWINLTPFAGSPTTPPITPAASEPANNGTGWAADNTVLQNTIITAGVWNFSVGLQALLYGGDGTNTLTVTGNLLCRLWVYHEDDTYTQVGSDMLQSGITLNYSVASGSPQGMTYTWTETLGTLPLLAGDTLYYEYYFQVTSVSTTGTDITNIALGLCDQANIVGGALTPTYIETPGYTPASPALLGPHGGLAFVTGRQKTIHFSGTFDFWTGTDNPPGPPSPGDFPNPCTNTTAERVIQWNGGLAVGGPADSIYTGEVMIRLWGGEANYNDPYNAGVWQTGGSTTNSYKLFIELINGGGISGGPPGNSAFANLTGTLTPSFIDYPPGSTGYLCHVTGTWTLDIDVQEAFEIVPYTAGGTPFPQIGVDSESGGAVTTGPYGAQIYWYDKARVGGTQAMAVSAEITDYTVTGAFPGNTLVYHAGTTTPLTASESHTILAGRAWDVLGDYVEGQARFYSDWVMNNSTTPAILPPWGLTNPPLSGTTLLTDGSNTNQYEVSGTAYVYRPFQSGTSEEGSGKPTYVAVPWTSSFPVKWFDFNSGIAIARVTNPVGLIGGYGHYGASAISGYEDVSCSFQLYPPRSVARTLKLYRYNEAYPDSVSVRVDTGATESPSDEIVSVTGGTFSRTDTQTSVLLSVFKAANPEQGFPSTFAGATPFNLSSFPGQAGFRLDSTWLTASAESNNNRCLMLGRKWDAGTVTHLQNYTLFDGSSLTGWAAGANTTLSLDFGIKAAVSGGPGSIIWNATAGQQEWSADRYLVFVIKSTAANQGFTVTAANVTGANPQVKHWDAQTGLADTFTTVMIDLCLPFGLTGDGADTQYTRFPVGSLSGNHWGVDYVDQITISGLVAGQDYTIQSISLAQKDHTHLNLVSPNYYLVPASPPDPDTGEVDPWFYPNAIADTDGRQSLEEYYMMVRFHPTPHWLQKTVSDLLAQIAVHPGWSAAVATSGIPADGWHDENQSAAYVWGGGLTYDAANGFVLGFDIDVSDGLPHTIPIQDAFDGVLGWPPFIGDPYENDGTYSASGAAPQLPLRCYHIFRGGVYGIVNNGTAPASGDTLSLTKTTDGTGTGMGTSDMQGEYLTGTPFAPDRTHQDLEVNDPADTVTNIQIWDGMRRRVCYGTMVTTIVFTPWNFEGDFGDLHRTAAIGKAIYYWHATNVVPPYEPGITQALVSSDGQSSNSRMIVDKQMSHRIVLLYQSGTALAGYKIYGADSFDDGATWTTPAVLFSAGQYPTAAVGPDGTIIRAAYIASNPSSGTIQAVVQQAGDLAPGSAFPLVDSTGAQIVTANDTFHIEPTASGLFVLHVNLGSTTQAYFSSDDGATWTKLDSSWGINGGTFPTIAVGHDGEVLLLARQSGLLVGALCYPGKAAATPFVCNKSGGVPLAIAADTFQVSQGLDPAARWVLTCVVKGENTVGSWFSTDAEGAGDSGIITFDRVIE